MSNVMAVFQNVDKCMRCNGCVVSCKRTWQMKALNPGVLKVAPDTRVMIKSQKRVDAGPFVRYSCWHCPDPPCAGRCPFKAITKEANGAVNVDPTLCNPDSPLCTKQCVTDCQRGGYPKVGVGSDLYATQKAWKCTLCFGRAGADADITSAMTTKYGNKLPTRVSAAEIAAVPEKAHEPSCVYTCPAKAMYWDTRASIVTTLKDGTWLSYNGDGSVVWGSKKYLIAGPKADPFVEDHLSPMVSSVLSSPFAKAALVPTLVLGGLLAISARRAKIEQDELETAGEAR
jgi:Fe-S-cluster-containing dehydrogenase component